MELGVIAFQTRNSWLNLNADLLFYELIECKNNPANKVSASQLLLTDLTAKIMPFIRYDQGDLISPKTEEGELAGIKKVYGRQDDNLLLQSGKVVSWLELYELVKKYSEIRQIKFIQKSFNYFEVMIVIAPESFDTLKQTLISRLKEITLPECTFSFIVVNEIPADPSGKIRFVTSEVNTDR